MARLRIVVVAQETDGDVYPLATCKFYAPGTATASGSSTSGTPFAGSLYAAISGGSPISTTQTLGSNGTLVVWTTSKSRVDVGIEPAGGGTAFVRQYEAAELDPADVVTSVSGEQSVIQTGTLAAPSVAWTSDLDTGFNVDSDGDVGVSKDGVGILETSGTTTYLRSPDGTDAATLTDAGVFTAPNVIKSHGYYLVTDYGITMSSSSTVAAANTTALQTLWTTVATDGGGVIVFPPGFCALNATTLDHALGFSSAVSIQGAGGNTILYFHGATGPFLNVATGATSAINYGFFRDFQFRHDDPVTSGATLQLGFVGNYLFENIRSIYNTPDAASLTSVRLAGSASALKFVNCKFATRSDEATLSGAGLVPIGLDVAISAGSPGGIEFHGTEFSGCQNISTGIRWLNTAAIDTVTFSGLCLVKDHETGMRFGFGSNNGTVANLIANGLTIDGITGQSLHYTPGGTASVINHQYVGCWFSGIDYIAILDNTGAGTLRGIQIDGCYLTGGTVRSIIASGVMSELYITSNRISTDVTAGGRYGLDIGDGVNAITDVNIEGNRIQVGASTAGAAQIAANVSPMHFGGGIVRGVRPVINGTLSNARVVTDYAFAP